MLKKRKCDKRKSRRGTDKPFYHSLSLEAQLAMQLDDENSTDSESDTCTPPTQGVRSLNRGSLESIPQIVVQTTHYSSSYGSSSPISSTASSASRTDTGSSTCVLPPISRSRTSVCELVKESAGAKRGRHKDNSPKTLQKLYKNSHRSTTLPQSSHHEVDRHTHPQKSAPDVVDRHTHSHESTPVSGYLPGILDSIDRNATHTDPFEDDLFINEIAKENTAVGFGGRVLLPDGEEFPASRQRRRLTPESVYFESQDKDELTESQDFYTFRSKTGYYNT